MPEYDVILYGATGFTGRQTAHYFDTEAPSDLRWAIAGRNAGKLAALQAELKRAPDTIIADSTDPTSISAMVSQTQVLLTTAGPFALYGTPVVEACVAHGVDYVDITGETPWARTLIDRFHERAVADGTRIIPFCGFDSIPSDLGTLMLVDFFREKGLATKRVLASFLAKGGLNGGTLASVINMAESGELKALGHTQLLNPIDWRPAYERAGSADLIRPQYCSDRAVWLAPFFMAPVNTRVVRRSNALSAQAGHAYGPEFLYNEAMEMPGRASAWGVTVGSGIVQAAMLKAWGRKLVSRFAPKPGQGPSEQAMNDGFTRCRLVGEAENGAKAMAVVQSQGDPGNRVTVKLLCESALALALDRETLPKGAGEGGVVTPATALGQALVSRLVHADFTMTVDDLPSSP